MTGRHRRRRPEPVDPAPADPASADLARRRPPSGTGSRTGRPDTASIDPAASIDPVEAIDAALDPVEALGDAPIAATAASLADVAVPRTARGVALLALTRIEGEQAYANLVLPALLGRSRLSDVDRRFTTELVYGSTRMRRALDAVIDPYLVREPDLATRCALRLGAYQLLFLGTPAHAAVGETVDVVGGRTRGLVNAILRRIAAQPPGWPDDADRLSYPDWIVDRLRADLGPTDALAALEAMNVAASATERDDGYVQDRASQWVATLVDAQPGERVADLCAAPGGKATALARTGASVVAADVRPSRARLVAANRDRLGLANLQVVCADGRRLPLRPGTFDRVLVDAPCTGLGSLRRRPDARWRIDGEGIDRLVPLQRALVTAAIELLRPGGLLVYSVCTLTAAETTGIDDWLATRWPDHTAEAAPESPWRPWGRGALLLPQAAGTDGMFVLRLRV